MSFNIAVPNLERDTLGFRVATSSSNTKFAIYQGNSHIGSLDSSLTGGYQSWKTMSTAIKLSTVNQKLKLVATGYN
ncbi:MAG: hypothetical protein ACI93L_002472 [Cyclobacteriaceae bacterium]